MTGGVAQEDITNPNASLDQFEILKLLGKGGFGKVFLAQKKDSGSLHAMKCIRKDLIIENEALKYITKEKEILKTVDHPFLINMEYVFQDETRIYFIMPFAKGGTVLQQMHEL